MLKNKMSTTIIASQILILASLQRRMATILARRRSDLVATKPRGFFLGLEPRFRFTLETFEAAVNGLKCY